MKKASPEARASAAGGAVPRAPASMTRRNLLLGGAGSLLVAALPGPARPAALATRFAPAPQSRLTVDHRPWDALLDRFLVVGSDGVNRVDYRAFKATGRAALNAYLAALHAIDPRRLARADQAAWWINLYNATTVSVVLSRYPVRSIREINLGGGFFGRGPWRRKLVPVAGTSLSLDDIEHEILRPGLRDPRIHYALNCASLSCPNLQPRAYTGANLESLLETGARAYVNHPRGLRVEGSRISASSIYKWYAADFGGRRGVMRHWLRYARADLAAALKKAGGRVNYHYDWNLNDAG